MQHRVDVAVVGAGIVGLAIARAISLTGRSVLILEQGGQIGAETSARNSEVIHAGLYYRPGSLKADLCRAGNAALYEYARRGGIPHRRLGKLIVATSDEQKSALEALFTNAQACGAEELEWLEAGQVRALEPEIRAAAALFSPRSGIIDSHALMTLLALRTRVDRILPSDKGFAVCTGSERREGVVAKHVVNAGGLHAQALAHRIEALDPACIPPSRYLKGYYFMLTGTRCPFSRLVYPIPHGLGLGIHATLDLAGQCRFGPDAVEWVDSIDYGFDETRAAAFYRAVRQYWPGMPSACLRPGFAGIRPKIHGPGESWQDFHMQGPNEHGIEGLVNLFGIDLPGLTSSLALAERVCRLIG